MQPLYRKVYETTDQCSEPAGDDELSTVGVRLVPGDTPEDVLEKILQKNHALEKTVLNHALEKTVLNTLPIMSYICTQFRKN